MTRLRGGLTACALFLACSGCGQGRDVNLGAVAGSSHEDAGVPPPAACDGKPCAEHRGSRVFVEASAAATSPEAFDEGTELGPGSEPDAEPALLYPSDETLLPVNLQRVRFAWHTGRSSV